MLVSNLFLRHPYREAMGSLCGELPEWPVLDGVWHSDDLDDFEWEALCIWADDKGPFYWLPGRAKVVLVDKVIVHSIRNGWIEDWRKA